MKAKLNKYMKSCYGKMMKPRNYFASVLFALVIYCTMLTVNCYCQQWQIYNTTNSGLPSNVIYDIAFDSGNVKWIGTDDGLARFDGTNWTVYDTANSPLPHPWVISVEIDNENVIWLGTSGGGIAKFDGLNWTIYDTNNSPLSSNIIPDIAVENNNLKWFCTSRGLSKFDNINWTIYNTTNSGLPNNQTWCIAVENNTKWIGTFGSGIGKYNDSNWIAYTFQNSGLPSNSIRGISVDYLGNKWIATFFGGIAKFNSVSNQWTVYNSTNSGLPSNNNWAILTQNHLKWIGGGGLAKFNDTSWTIFNTLNSPLPSDDVLELALDRTGRLWIGTLFGLAVYNTGLIGINNYTLEVPKSFELKQNYPNPFNPFTSIEYELYKFSIVTLIIYDIEGEAVKILENSSKKNAGFYRIDFDASLLPSGIYFYKFQVEGYAESKKMVLVK